MSALVIVGAQWGDEGKGKITDYLARDADVVVRYQGGNNAGHTIVVGDDTYKFHLIPSGILYQDKTCVLGNGVVVDVAQLVGELDALQKQDRDTSGFVISDQAHVILPTHQFLDKRAETAKGEEKIGTTGRGIGPAYRDKVQRTGIRIADLADESLLRKKLAQHFENESALTESEWTPDSVTKHVLGLFPRIQEHIANTPAYLNRRLDQGARVLLEGAQGTLLDIDHGTYPFVTSSSPTAGGACIGAGIGPTRIKRVVGVAKAYTTRVGAGPFPTELTDETGEMFRKHGHEFGTTTGRARRCGWLDLVALRYAVLINGLTHIALTKMDVLDHFDSLKVCTKYKIDGKETEEFPSRLDALEQAEPVWTTLPGWKTPLTKTEKWRDLPQEALSYVSHIEDYLRIPVSLVSIGAERDATFSRLAIWEGT